jgi:hypothetical protein
MERNTFYIIKNTKTNEVWSGYKWKKGTWQKAMLYKSPATINNKIAELTSRGYDCVVMRLVITIEEY